MRKFTFFRYFIISIVFIILGGNYPAAPQSKSDLIPAHKEWLETVAPIITKTERGVFLKLRTPEERDKFIQFFWKQRDPRPDTAENEFYKEYMERVRFADQTFHDSFKKGSQTERGYYYLLLGPPLERTSYTTNSQIWPLELWFYKGDQQYGLPPYFYLIFYQPEGIGEYRLYSPGVEGPEKLVISSLYSGTLDRNTAFQLIKKINAELARASLSYLPGDQPYGLTSFSSDTVIVSIRSVPERKFSDAYARSYLDYKDFVETDYSDNYIQSSFKVKVFKSSGQFFIHWSCEPEKVSFAQQNETYSASFELILRMEDFQGNPILEKQEEIPLKLNAEQYKKHERQHFAFQDILPAIAGKYKFFILIKNKTAKDFSSFDTEVSVPEEDGSPLVSNLLLYQARERVLDAQKNNLKAFSFAANQYLFNTRNEFTPQGELGCYLQVYNFQVKPENSVASVLFEINSLDSKSVVVSQRKPLGEVLSSDREGMDIGPFSLSTLKPGYFEVEVSLLDASGRKLLSRKEGFVILAQPYLVLPWVYSRLHNPFPNSEGLYFLSSQYFIVQKYEKARNLLEQAMRLKDEPRIRLLLAKSLFALKQYQDSLTHVVPVYQATHNREAAKVIALNYTGLKDWSSALIYLNKLLEEATEVGVLNLAAECYLNLNQPEKALPLIQKSLELNSAQPAVKELEEKAKKALAK